MATGRRRLINPACPYVLYMLLVPVYKVDVGGIPILCMLLVPGCNVDVGGIPVLCMLLVPVCKVGVGGGDGKLHEEIIVPYLHSSPFLQWDIVTGYSCFR